MNVIDYLEWRGDLSFETDPLNEIDALIFAWLSYYEMEKFRDSGISFIGKTISQIVEVHKNEIDVEKTSWVEIDKEKNLNLTIIPGESAAYLFWRASQTVRFKDAFLVEFKEIFSKDDIIQFAASCYEYAPKKRVVAFRGTDASLIGWKEDCMLSYRTEIPGQAAAVSFFHDQASGYDYTITGHSKGGNEALYCLLKMDEKRVKDVTALYNYDGPGFLEKLQETDRYKQVKTIIHSYIPKDSIVGMLLEHEEDYFVVKSGAASAMQHDAMFWYILGKKFILEDKTSLSSRSMNKTFAAFLNHPDLTMEDKEDIVNLLFSMFDKSDMKNITEITNDFWGNIGGIMAQLKDVDDEQKETVKKVTKILAKTGIQASFETTKESITKKLEQGNEKLVSGFGKFLNRLTSGEDE